MRRNLCHAALAPASPDTWRGRGSPEHGLSLAECGKSSVAEALAGLASTLNSAANAVAADAGPVLVFAEEQDAERFSQWVAAVNCPRRGRRAPRQTTLSRR
jgi:hypothetical protein